MEDLRERLFRYFRCVEQLRGLGKAVVSVCKL